MKTLKDEIKEAERKLKIVLRMLEDFYSTSSLRIPLLEYLVYHPRDYKNEDDFLFDVIKKAIKLKNKLKIK